MLMGMNNSLSSPLKLDFSVKPNKVFEIDFYTMNRILVCALQNGPSKFLSTYCFLGTEMKAIISIIHSADGSTPSTCPKSYHGISRTGDGYVT